MIYIKISAPCDRDKKVYIHVKLPLLPKIHLFINSPKTRLSCRTALEVSLFFDEIPELHS
jgi:hypothetical protein